MHCLLWVKGASKINIDSDGAVCQFIHQYITGVVPQIVMKIRRSEICCLI